ncbi:MAG: M1 family aminopeptidase [Bacteroidia bacterium]|nr:M1 family aminopeptidase [Bacteroidia bacterium]
MRKWFLIAISILLCALANAQHNPLAHSQCKNWETFEKIELERRGIENQPYNYTIGYNRISLSVFPRASSTIFGSVMSIFQITKNTDTIRFDLNNNMIVDSVVRNRNKLPFIHLENKIAILKPNWTEGQIDSVTVFYHGNPVSSGGFGYFVRDRHATDDIIHTLSQPYGAAHWWPCKQTLLDKIDSIDLFITTHKDMKVASNGLLVGEKQINALNTQYHWKHRYPIVTYLVAIAVTNYSEYTEYAKIPSRPDGLPILNYVFPQFASVYPNQTDTTVQILKAFDRVFGDYPFAKEKYGHAQFMWGGGMEHQTMSFMGSFNSDLIAHELAHQWFGDATTCGSWEDLWLNEGFATYATVLSREFLQDSAAFREIKYWFRLMGMTPNTGTVKAQDTVNVSNLFKQYLRYNKGGFVLHMIRRKIGDSLFFKNVKRYLNHPKHAYGFARTNDFKEVISEGYKGSLDTLFTEFYYGDGYPVLHINWSQRASQFTVEINQSPVTPISNAFFHIPVPLTLITKNGKRIYKTVYPQKAKETYSFKLQEQIVSVVFDEDINVMALDTVKGINYNLYGDEIVLWPNPTSNTLYVSGNKIPLERVNIIDASGKIVLKNIKAIENEGVLKIDVSKLSTGFYVLMLKNEQKSLKFEIIK